MLVLQRDHFVNIMSKVVYLALALEAVVGEEFCERAGFKCWLSCFDVYSCVDADTLNPSRTCFLGFFIIKLLE